MFLYKIFIFKDKTNTTHKSTVKKNIAKKNGMNCILEWCFQLADLNNELTPP